MIYRNFGNTGFSPSALGFGCMRLPIHNNDPSDIIEEDAIAMIRYAIQNGVNYFDTAYPYHRGKSEVVLGKALKDGYREEVKIADKMPLWTLEKPEDADRVFEEQLQRLDVSTIDFYLLHALNHKSWEKTKNLKLLDWAERQLAAGRIKHFGFSYHDKPEHFQPIVDGFPHWEFCMVQYNLMDLDFQAGQKGVQYAASKGLGVIAMEPLRGGDIVRSIPPVIEEIWQTGGQRRDPVEYSFRWLWSQPEVSFLISGMSSMEDVIQNIGLAGEADKAMLDESDRDVIRRVRESYLNLKPVGCTGCEYCLPCPQSIPVPSLIGIFNEYNLFHNDGKVRFMLSTIPEEKRPDHCNTCKSCLEKCPQQLDIPSILQEIQALYQDLGLVTKES